MIFLVLLQKTFVMLIWYKQPNSKNEHFLNMYFFFSYQFILQRIWMIQDTTIPSTLLHLNISFVSALVDSAINNSASISLFTDTKANSVSTCVSDWILLIQFCWKSPKVLSVYEIFTWTMYLNSNILPSPTVTCSLGQNGYLVGISY